MRRLLVIPLIIAYLICATPYFICGVLQFLASVPVFVIEGINHYFRFDSSFIELMKGGK